jgi:hypothetical protein
MTFYLSIILYFVNTICMRSWYIAAHIWKIYYFKIRVPLIINFSTARYKSKNDAGESVSAVSLTSSSGGYINGRNSANIELLIDKTSSIYLYVKLKANFPNMCSNIPASPAYGVYTSQLIRYARASSNYSDFLK